MEEESPRLFSIVVWLHLPKLSRCVFAYIAGFNISF